MEILCTNLIFFTNLYTEFLVVKCLKVIHLPVFRDLFIVISMTFDRLPCALLFFYADGPVLMCSKYEHHSRLGGSVRVVCEVDANPLSHSVKWMMDVMGESATTRHLLISDNNIQLSETVSFTLLNGIIRNLYINLFRRTDLSKCSVIDM